MVLSVFWVSSVREHAGILLRIRDHQEVLL